ncbi:PAS domain S-box protein [Cytophagaceae bacterium ABcell3]|nr:PAS domain S-box protein [Cytophagaceae bacterium ABcell3]
MDFLGIRTMLEELIEDVGFPVVVTGKQLQILIANKSAENAFPVLKDLYERPIASLFQGLGIKVENLTQLIDKPELLDIGIENYFIKVSPFHSQDFIGYLIKFKPSVPKVHGKYKKLFENIREGIVIFDETGRIKEANPSACEIYNASADYLSTINVKSLFPHKSSKEADQIWGEFMRTGFLSGLYKFKPIGREKPIYIEFDARTNFIPGLHLGVFSEVTGQKLTEKALKASEANLKAVLNNNNQSLFLLSVHGSIITFNKRADEVFREQRGRGLAIGESVFEGMNAETISYIKPLFDEVVKGNVMQHEFHATWINPDLWIEVYANPVYDAYGNVDKICLTANDISYRKRSEISLKESEARFRSLVQNSSDVILVLEESSQVTYCSESVQNVLGFAEDQILGKKFTSFVHASDKKGLEDIISHTLKTENKIFISEFRFLSNEGHYLYLEATFNNQFNNEFINGIVINVRDVSFKKAQEENLLLLERAIDSSNNGIVITDPNLPDNPIVYANKAFEKITGYRYQEVVGKNCRFLQNKERNQLGLDVLRKAVAEQKQVTVILKNYRKDGTLFWNELSVSPVINRKGELVNFIGVLNDISERKIAEDSLLEITKGVSGKDFYVFLAEHLSVVLDVQSVFIGEYSQSKIRSKVLFRNGEVLTNFVLPVNHSLGLKVLEENSDLYLEGVSDPVPELELPEEDTLYYMGVPLSDSSGKKIGVLEIRNATPFRNLSLAKSLLNIFSVRVSAELERDVYIHALKNSEKKFRILSENSPDLIFIVDLSEKKPLYFNKSTFLGHPVNWFELNKDKYNLIHPSDKERVLKHWSIFVKQEIADSSSIEYRVKNQEGGYEWVDNRHSVINDVEGHHKVILVTLAVNTERKKMEENLRESEARLTALVENTSDMIWSVDKSLNFTTLNSAFRLFLKVHYKKEVSVGDNLNDVFPEGVKREWLAMHFKALRGERFSTEFVSFPGQSNETSYEISYNPISSPGGSVSGISVFARDITLRKSSEKAIIKTNFELDSFVYRASHDLRAPLRSMLGLSNLVKNEEDAGQRNNYLDLINKSIEKLDNFIADLTNYSRNSRLDLSCEEIDFKRIYEECVEELKFMDNMGDVHMEFSQEGTVPFYSDKMRISIIFHNILSNAIKYKNRYISDSFCKVHVKVSEAFADITIKDNGIGIKEDYLSRVFDMFFRASHSSYGSGLGLYITKQVVEKLNGNISVESSQGAGTSFYIRVPNNIANKKEVEQ